MEDPVYQQEGRRCVGYAIANAIFDKTGVRVTSKQILDYYDKHFGGDKGVATHIFLLRMRKYPLAGVTCSYRTIFSDQKKDAGWMGRFREATLQKEVAVLCSLKITEHKRGEQQIPLDKEYNLIPRDTKVVSHHAVLCKGLAQSRVWNWRQRYLFENSWGKDWGKEGFFYIKGSDLNQPNGKSVLRAAYAVRFKKV